ncbi:unnamed protein product [Caenorhabditis nigoni]
MGRKPKKNQTREKNAILARNSIENRHEVIKRELREQLFKKIAELENQRVEKEAMMMELEHVKLENHQLHSELKEKNETVHDLNLEVARLQRKLLELERSADFVGDQVSVLRREKKALEEGRKSIENELQSTINNQHQTIQRAVQTQSRALALVHQKKFNEMERKISELVASSPTGGSSMKSYRKGNRLQTTNFRCEKALESLRRSVGDKDFDDFITDLCHYVAKNPQYSFKLVLSDLDSFYATVKWKLSDGFLKEFKSFLVQKLDHDVFASRHKIDELRKQHSGSDLYEISVIPIIKRLGSRDVSIDSAVIQATDLALLLRRRLERLHSNGLLLFDDPDSPIILGVGGDKGGDYTKLVVVFGNLKNPNNPYSILLIGMYDGNDDYKSLQKNLSSVFEQINLLDSLEYMENGNLVKRKIRKLLLGDCKFLSAVVGHGGQCTSTPCFLCKLVWSYRGANASRLGTFDFSSSGKSYEPADLKTPLLLFHAINISLPTLHIFLGIVQTYFVDWFFALCNSIDFGDHLPEDLKQQKKVLKNLHEQEAFYDARYGRFLAARESVDKMIEIAEKCLSSGHALHQKASSCDAKFCFIGSANKQFLSNSEMFRCELCESHVHELCALIITPEDVEKLKHQPKTCFDCRKKSPASLESRKKCLLKIKNFVDKQVENDEAVLIDVTNEREKLEEMLHKSTGPTRRRLEEVLRSIRCDSRAFYQQLTGNQARLLLRPENIEKIIAIFPVDSSDKLLPMKEAMLTLGRLMSTANNAMKSDEEIEEIRGLLWNFQNYLKEAQPNAVTTPNWNRKDTSECLVFCNLKFYTQANLEFCCNVVQEKNPKCCTREISFCR